MSKSPTRKRRLLWCCLPAFAAFLFSMPAAHAKYKCYRTAPLPQPTVFMLQNADSIYFSAHPEGSNPNEYCWKMEIRRSSSASWEVLSEDCVQTTGYWNTNVGQYYSWAEAGISPFVTGWMKARVQLHRKECPDNIRSPWGYSGAQRYVRQQQ